MAGFIHLTNLERKRTKTKDDNGSISINPRTHGSQEKKTSNRRVKRIIHGKEKKKK